MIALRKDAAPDAGGDNLDSPTDEELVRHARDDADRFASIYERYEKEIERYFLARNGGNVEFAQDLTSQVFIRAIAALPRFTEGSLRGWLYQIARNSLIDAWRRQRPSASLDRIAHIASNERSLDERVIADEARIQLHNALDGLGEPHRTIILLRLQGLAGSEIAERLNMNLQAMKSAQYRAMAKLRANLQHLHLRDER